MVVENTMLPLQAFELTHISQRALSVFVSSLGSPILALTATADGQTQSVIIKELEMKEVKPKPAKSAHISSEMQARRNV